jgi:hypothetical protein
MANASPQRKSNNDRLSGGELQLRSLGSKSYRG